MTPDMTLEQALSALDSTDTNQRVEAIETLIRLNYTPALPQIVQITIAGKNQLLLRRILDQLPQSAFLTAASTETLVETLYQINPNLRARSYTVLPPELFLAASIGDTLKRRGTSEALDGWRSWASAAQPDAAEAPPPAELDFEESAALDDDAKLDVTPTPAREEWQAYPPETGGDHSSVAPGSPGSRADSLPPPRPAAPITSPSGVFGGLPEPEPQAEALPPEPVMFSAYPPKTIKTDDWQPLYAYVFRENAAQSVLADALKQLGGKQAGYSAITQPGKAIAEGAEIVARPNLPGFQFNPIEVRIGFYDAWARFDFSLRARQAPLNQFTTGTITFTVEGIIVADLPISVFVGEAGAPSEVNNMVTRMYQAIFCSYSHKDTAIVERVERAYKALGLDYLRDVTTLKSGEHWGNEILELIDRADIFQLFWSEAAAESPYVQQEWQHALQYESQRTNFIRPVWWREPMASVPDALSHIHFAYQPDLGE